MEAVAKLKNCPMSARKMRMTAGIIRGKGITEALGILKFSKREGSIWLEKVLLSAVANWENKNDMALSADDHDLFIKTLLVDQGTSLKRFRPAPHGRAHRIRKHQNHVTLVVENRVTIDADNEVVSETSEA